MIELTGDEELALKRVGNRAAAHRLNEEGKGALVNYAEHLGILSDSMTICKNISNCMDVVDFEVKPIQACSAGRSPPKRSGMPAP